ncbi:hypothetical protein E2P81_ATG10889 [Venturia nashicola]|nr:hypothetical protein E2P81_ATG10889 [Venturia nashicola]
MAKEKPELKKDKIKAARRVPTDQRRVTVTLPNGISRTHNIGPVPRLRNGGVRKRFARKKAKYAWNTKARKSNVEFLKRKDEPKRHYKGLSTEQKATITPMSFMDLPGELRNEIYPSLLDEIEGRTLIFTNNPTGLVAAWPATVVPRIPIGLLSAGNKQIRNELLPLAYEKVDVQIRIVSAHLKSTAELYAWVNGNDAIPFGSMNVTLITKLSLTILLPCSFETIHKDQGCNFTFLTRMAKLKLLRLRVQVHVPNSHIAPWTTLHTQVPDTTFTPFVTQLIQSLFQHIPKTARVEFGDGVEKDEGGLGTWVDVRADGGRDQGWMENPKIGEVQVGAGRAQKDTVAVPVHQAESVWGRFRGEMGMADAFTTSFDPGEVEDADTEKDVQWNNEMGIGENKDPMVISINTEPVVKEKHTDMNMSDLDLEPASDPDSHAVVQKNKKEKGL